VSLSRKYDTAIQAIKNGKHDKGILLLEEIVNVDPKDKDKNTVIEANLLLGDIYSGVKFVSDIALNIDKAIECYGIAKDLSEVENPSLSGGVNLVTEVIDADDDIRVATTLKGGGGLGMLAAGSALTSGMAGAALMGPIGAGVGAAVIAYKAYKETLESESESENSNDSDLNYNYRIRAYNVADFAKKHLEARKEIELKNEEITRQDNKLLEAQKIIKQKNKELNNLIAMFAHNFLGTLQCIQSNAEHDNNPSIHLKTVKMMGGALTAFSIISADDDKLIEQLKQDHTGESNLLQNLANNLALAISQLLSKTNKDKIINIYLNYLQKTGEIKPETNGEELRFNKGYRKKWQALQRQWEDEFNTLFSEQVELGSLKKWINDNFFNIEIIGFDDNPIDFKEYGITDSIFLVVLMETLVNALKYMDVKANKPLTLEFFKQNNAYQLICENPSQQESYRGTHKGMDFLQTIANKLNGEFISESTENTFKTTFSIPAKLLD